MHTCLRCFPEAEELYDLSVGAANTITCMMCSIGVCVHAGFRGETIDCI